VQRKAGPLAPSGNFAASPWAIAASRAIPFRATPTSPAPPIDFSVGAPRTVGAPRITAQPLGVAAA
jgi:hypothetical protein